MFFPRTAPAVGPQMAWAPGPGPSRPNGPMHKCIPACQSLVLPKTSRLLKVLKVSPLIATLKLQSNEASYSSTVIGTLTVGGLLHLVQRGGDWVGPSWPRPLLPVPNVTAHLSTACVPTSYYST